MTPSEEIRRALERLNEKNPDCYLAVTPRKGDGYIINDKLIALIRSVDALTLRRDSEFAIAMQGNARQALIALVRAINGEQT